MARDHRKLKVFVVADDLVTHVYRATQRFPDEERYGLQAQLRRASVSIVANLVEGCARRTTRDYVHFVNMALASASEVRYLLGLAHRLGYLDLRRAQQLADGYTGAIKGMQVLIDRLEPPSGLKPEA